jgi:LacI family transcriptional regulator
MSPARASGRVTLVDVARLAEVDRSVVSRVLSDDPRLNVREETRQRVLDAVAELDYRPNAIAQSLRTQRSGTFGLLIPDWRNPVYASIIRGAETAAAAHDLVLLTGSLDGSVHDTDRYVRTLSRGRVDGLLLSGTEAGGDLVRWLQERRIPWLLVNRRIQGARRWVVLDDQRAAQIAVEHLVELGHERIAHISGPRIADTARRRLSGYRSAMKAAGLTVDPAHVVGSDYSSEGGAEAMASLLRQRPRPTAVLAANVASAIGALSAAHDAGVDVPRQLSVVAVHDLELASYLQPALTTVRTPLVELGRRAVELLATADPDDEIHEVVGGSIDVIVRASTAPPR